MINVNRNSAVGYRRRGDGYGIELNTTANAISPTNEADAIIGWGEYGLNGTGSNVFESQGAIKTDGSYGFHLECNDTPTNYARIFIDLQAAPFSFTDGEEGRLTFDIRHVGTGDVWGVYMSNTDFGNTNIVATILTVETAFKSVEFTWTHNATYRYLIIREAGANTGGIYLDNTSIKKKL